MAGLCCFGRAGESTGLLSGRTLPGQHGVAFGVVRKGWGLQYNWGGLGSCLGNEGPFVWGGGSLLLSFLFLSWKLVALLLGDKETQLSSAAALDGTLASIVPAFTSGANVSPREGLLDPRFSPTILHVLPPQPFVSGSRC